MLSIMVKRMIRLMSENVLVSIKVQVGGVFRIIMLEYMFDVFVGVGFLKKI